MQEEMENYKEYESLKNIIKKERPEHVFRTIKQLEGNSFKIKAKNNLAIIIDPKEKAEKCIMRELVNTQRSIN